MSIALRTRLLDAALVDHQSLSMALAAAQDAEAWIGSGTALGRGPAAVAPPGGVGPSEEPLNAPEALPWLQTQHTPESEEVWAEPTLRAISEISQAGRRVAKTTLSAHMRVPIDIAARRLKQLYVTGRVERHGRYNGTHYRLPGDGPLVEITPNISSYEAEWVGETMAALHALVGQKKQATTVALARELRSSMDKVRRRFTTLLHQGKVRNVGTAIRHVYWPVDIGFSEERAPAAEPEAWEDPQPDTWTDDLMSIIADLRSRNVRVTRRVIQERMGITQGVAYNRLDKLLERGRLKRAGGGNRVEYRLPDEPSDPWGPVALVEEEPAVAPGDPMVIYKAAQYLRGLGIPVEGGPDEFIVYGQRRDGQWIVETANRHRMRNDERPFLLGGPLVSPGRGQG